MDQKAPLLQNGLRFSGFGGSMAAGSAGFAASMDWATFLKPSRSLARKLTENGFGAFGSYRLSPSVVRTTSSRRPFAMIVGPVRTTSTMAVTGISTWRVFAARAATPSWSMVIRLPAVQFDRTEHAFGTNQGFRTLRGRLLRLKRGLWVCHLSLLLNVKAFRQRRLCVPGPAIAAVANAVSLSRLFRHRR